MKKPELLAPAGNMESLYAAIEARCDAVYLSGYMFGARQFAGNFSEEEIKEAINLCHLYGIKVYVTVNTLIYDDEVKTFLNYIDFLHKNNVDAVLVQDIGMLDLIRQTYPNLEVHASTQMHIHNLDGIKFCEKMGVKRVVLARETSINNIKNIKENTNLEIEVFVHGALCVSYSGQCLMSSLIGGRSGNRGACAGSCRLPYKIVDDKGNRYNKNDYPISMRDLNALESIGDFIDLGIDSLKIEGRMKRPEYVYTVVSLYRKAIDSYVSTGKVEILEEDIYELKKIFNRNFTKGFIFNNDNNYITSDYRPNHLGVEIGKVLNYNKGYVTVKLSSNLNIGDGIRILESDIGCTITNMYLKKEKIKSGRKGDLVSFKLDGNIKAGNTLVKTTDKKQLEDIMKIIKLNLRKVAITGKIFICKDKPLKLVISDNKNEVSVEGTIIEKAKNNPLTEDVIRKQIDRLGNTIYCFKQLEIFMEEDCFVTMKDLNEIRRKAIEKLNELRQYKIEYRKCEYDRKIPVLKTEQSKTCFVTKECLNNISNKNYDYIYVEEDLYEQINNKDNIILKLPRVIEGKKSTNIPVMISELGGLENSNIEASDFSLNVVNSYSLALLHSLGVNKVTLSYELSFEQIKRLIDDYKARYKSLPNVEVIVYSRVEAMVMKFDLLDYYKINNKVYLVDKFNNKYPIQKRNGYTYILDYKIRKIDNIDDYYDIGVNSIRYQYLINKDYLNIDTYS